MSSFLHMWLLTLFHDLDSIAIAHLLRPSGSLPWSLIYMKFFKRHNDIVSLIVMYVSDSFYIGFSNSEVLKVRRLSRISEFGQKNFFTKIDETPPAR